MSKFLFRVTCACLLVCAISIFNIFEVYAEEAAPEEQNNQKIILYGSEISISPISEIVQLSSDTPYESTFTVTNDGDDSVNFEVFVAPYSYIHSDEDNTYTLGFTNENNYTQITRWTRIKDSNGNYVKNPHFTIGGHEKMEISYRITAPENMPAGGQYAVIFVHSTADEWGDGGIKTETSPGLVIYGRANGETVISGEISDLNLNQTITKEAENGKSTTYGHINASAKVKNTGNIDFNATATLKVESVFGGGYYQTPENKARTSVIPESELVLSDEWENTPAFGLYKATWTVVAAGETQAIEQMVFINPVPFIIISIILLTIIIVWITIMLRKRKERRARLAA
jgi:hypothetical protein